MTRQLWGTGTSTHRWLEVISLAYLSLPVCIFLLGWVKLPWALLFMGLLLVALYFYIRNATGSSVELFSFQKYKKVLLWCAVLLLGWILISGVGGSHHQSTDYNKHNAVMSDLVTHSWPVAYQIDHKSQPLVYYIAYYLPSATLGKIFSSVWLAEFSLLPWTVLGIFLSFYWLARICKRPTVTLAIVFIFFSGMDILGQLLVGTSQNTISLINIFSNIEAYAGAIGANYPADTTTLFWAPQHAIPAWIITGMIIAIIVEKRKNIYPALLVIIGLLWSPLIMIGMLPLLVAYFITLKRKLIIFKPSFLIPTLALSIPILLFFASGSSHQPLGTMFQYGSGRTFYRLGLYALFVMLEFGVLSLLIAKSVFKKEGYEWRLLFVTCISFLLLLPFLHYGLLNDLGLRASVPSLFVIMALTVRYLHSFNATLVLKDIYVYTAVIVVLVLGSVNTLIELNVHLRGPAGNTHFWPSIGSQTLNERDKLFARQYLGNNDSIFFKNIAR